MRSCAIIRGVDAGIVVVADGGNVFLRCQRCGLSCPVPPDLLARAVDDFYRDHRRDVDVALHPTECPAWAVRSVLDLT